MRVHVKQHCAPLSSTPISPTATPRLATSLRHAIGIGAARRQNTNTHSLSTQAMCTLNLSGHVALDEGRLEDAAHFYHKAIISDPLSPAAHAGLAAALWASGRLAEAEAAFRQLVSLVSNDSAGWLGVLMVERGQEAGLEQINRDTNESIRLVTLSMANYRLGRRVESDQALAELIKKYADSPCRIAQALAYRGESDAAFRWLETAYAAHDKDLMWIKIHAGLRGLPRDARFASLLRRMNLPE
jgi:adenylate cyclase